MKISNFHINNEEYKYQQFLVQNENDSNRDHVDAATMLLLDIGGCARCKQKTELAQIAEAYAKNEFREPRGLHLPVHRMLKFLLDN